MVSVDQSATPPVLLKIDVATGKGKVACQFSGTANYPSTTFSRNGTLFASRGTAIDSIDPCTCAVSVVGATGFTQYLRRPPILSQRQRLSIDERGGLSFDERSYTD